MKSKLYLIPNGLGEDSSVDAIPSYVLVIVKTIRCFAVEDEPRAKRFLKRVDPQFPFPECVFFRLNEHTSRKEVEKFFKETEDHDVGIIAEAGCPCVADPGADLVFLAHQRNREVIPLVGPCSILLALMGSGLNGQNFAFNGYLPKERQARIKKLKNLEGRSHSEQQTQIFMEAPYRNQSLFQEIIASCHPETLLCLAADITCTTQYIKTLPVKDWASKNPPLEKRPVLFILHRL